MSEGNILVLGDTTKRSHRVILVVGKEPNNNLETANRIDNYGADWTQHGKGASCQYWNMAYSLSGRIIGTSRASLRGRCAAAQSSPIAFADLSPLSLDGSYSPHTKIKKRQELKKEDYKDHLQSVFSHKIFMKRVDLVICAGHKNVGLCIGYPILENLCRESKIEFCHIASLNSTRHTLDHRLNEMGNKKNIVSAAFDSFSLELKPDGFNLAA